MSLQSAQFFRELENFLPVHVPAIPSYVHSTVVFLLVSIIGYVLSEKSEATLDVDGDNQESDTERKMRKFIYRGTAVFIALMLADLTFNISWRLRNKVNRRHLVYSRWFPKLYNP